MARTALRGFGFSTHLERRHANNRVEEQLPLLLDIGADVVRQEISWPWLEPAKGAPRFDPRPPAAAWVDPVLDAGLGLIVVLAYDNPAYENSLDPDGFCRYARCLARHLRGRRVVAYEFWNEPTNFVFRARFGGAWSALAPCAWAEEFVALQARAAAAIKDEDPDAVVITNPGECQWMNMIRQWPEAFRDVDGVSYHPYPNRLPPETLAWGGEQIRRRDGVDAADDDHAAESLWRRSREDGLTFLGRAPRLFTTEYGCTTYYPHRKPGLFSGVTEYTQAAYLTRGMLLQFAAGVEAVCLYDFMDDGPDPEDPEDNFGVVRHAGGGPSHLAPKASYFALRRLADALGRDWRVAERPFARLDMPVREAAVNQDDWQRLSGVDRRYIRHHEPMARWFETPAARVGFVWKAGRVDAENRPPEGAFVLDGEDARRAWTIRGVDVATGEAVPLTARRDGDTLRVEGLRAAAAPLAVTFTPASGGW